MHVYMDPFGPFGPLPLRCQRTVSAALCSLQRDVILANIYVDVRRSGRCVHFSWFLVVRLGGWIGNGRGVSFNMSLSVCVCVYVCVCVCVFVCMYISQMDMFVGER